MLERADAGTGYRRGNGQGRSCRARARSGHSRPVHLTERREHQSARRADWAGGLGFRRSDQAEECWCCP